MDTVWTFETANFRVTLECEPERDPDLSWADAETLENLRSGLWENLTFKVAVYDARGAEVAANYLCNSIHADPRDFMDHRACGRANREWEARGERGRCGSYFTDLIRETCREARQVWNSPRARLRAA